MLDRINKQRNKLSNAEKRVAEWMLKHPRKVLELPLSAIAEATEVSQPTIIRFTRHVGATGYSDFKMRLAQHLAQVQQKSLNDIESTLHADVTAKDDTNQILAKVMGRSIRELSYVQKNLDADTIDQAANSLAVAQVINFFGVGASGIVAEDAQNKFFRLGVPCNVYRDRPTLMQAAAIADQQHSVIAISKTGMPSAVVDALVMARANGASTIAVTSPASALAQACDITISLDVDEDTGSFTPMSSRLAQLAVLDVLQVAYALKLGERGIRKQELAKIALRESFST